jgi:hypothetical protein
MSVIWKRTVPAAVCLINAPALAQYLEHPRNRCPIDLAQPSGIVNFFDLARYLQMHAAADPAADIAPPFGTVNFFDLAAYLNAFTRGCALDSDADGIPDWAETNDGIFRGPFATGTDPVNPDTDADGLSDGDEVFGTLEGLDLPALGADPLRKDIFIECDWFAGEFEGVPRDFRPRALAVQRLVQAFADAPVPNPYDAPDGVTIHLDYGQGGPFTGGNQLPGAPVFILFPEDFRVYKQAFFDPRRLGCFHYAVFANRYDSAENRSSGVAEIVGDDFMVTMVDYLSSYNQSQTIMHELGHNLGLRHGGFENRNWKPNYNSVMNYRHQFTGVDTDGNTFGNGGLDFSWGANNTVDENAVLEPVGVLGFPVDFNADGVIQQSPYARNLNCESGSAPCSVGTGCADSVCTPLIDHDDWGSIIWSRLDNAESLEPAEIAECESQPAVAVQPPED